MTITAASTALIRTKPFGQRVARRFAKDSRGVAAIEFAYLAPVLLVMLLGTIEVSRGISIDRRFSLVTSSVGDLVAREKTIAPSPADSLYGIMQSAQSILAPYDGSSLNLRIMSVMALSTDTTQGKVRWAYDCTSTSCTPATGVSACSSYTLPSGIVSQYGSVIIVTSSYSFAPLFTNWTGNSMKAGNWTDKSTHSPRNSCVDDGNGCPTSSTTCP